MHRTGVLLDPPMARCPANGDSQPICSLLFGSFVAGALRSGAVSTGHRSSQGTTDPDPAGETFHRSPFRGRSTIGNVRSPNGSSSAPAVFTAAPLQAFQAAPKGSICVTAAAIPKAATTATNPTCPGICSAMERPPSGLPSFRARNRHKDSSRDNSRHRRHQNTALASCTRLLSFLLN